MADRSLKNQQHSDGVWVTSKMPEEDIGHTCMYVVEDDDRNFKVCVYCGNTQYRTDDEILRDHGVAKERKIDE